MVWLWFIMMRPALTFDLIFIVVLLQILVYVEFASTMCILGEVRV